MGLFNKAQPPTPAAPAPARSQQGPSEKQQGSPAGSRAGATVIARQANVKGKISGAGEFVIEGRLEGELRCEGRVSVLETGTVKGTLQGKSIRVSGSVEGDVSAEERVELTPSARLVGNITAPRMHIAEGATFEGQVFMRTPGKGSAGEEGSSGGGGGSDGATGPRGGRQSRKDGA